MSITAKEVNELKAKLKEECARRDGVGSVKHLSSEKYDFDVNPEKGGKISEEHGQKTVDILLQIKNDVGDLKPVKKGEAIPKSFNKDLIALIDAIAQEQKAGENEKTSCSAMCTGLCTGSCKGYCNGCTGCTGLSGKVQNNGNNITNGVKSK